MAVAGPPSSGRRGKSPEAFRTISEVAGELDVPQHVLRFWESKFSQVKPLKRGGGRRYYRPEDVDLLRGIRHLLYVDGYTIKGAQKLLRQGGEPTSSADIYEINDRSGTNETAAAPLAAQPKGAVTRSEIEGILKELQSIRALLKS